MTAVVIAGAGYVGSRVLSLVQPDCEVLIVGRSGIAANEISGRSTQQIVDLDSVAEQQIEVSSPTVVLYTVPPSSNAANATTEPRLENFLGSLSSTPKRIVYLSTSGVYGDCRGRLVNENDQIRPQSDRAKRRVIAENMLTDYCDRRDSELSVLRVPGIYGPGRLGMKRIQSGTPIIAEDEAGPGNRIHVDDLARCCIVAMAHDAPTGVFNVGDGDHRSSSWFSQTVARLAERPPIPEVSRQEAESLFSESRLSFLNESRRLDTTKMKTVLGFEPRYKDAEDGIRASLDTAVNARSPQDDEAIF